MKVKEESGKVGLKLNIQKTKISRVFSNITIQKYQFFDAQPSLWPNSISVHDYWKNDSFDYIDLCQQSDVSAF